MIKLQRSAEARKIAHQMSGISEFSITSRNMPRKLKFAARLLGILSQECYTIREKRQEIYKTLRAI